jgi:predicted enzyme related to lactoylglutathione lyase
MSLFNFSGGYVPVRDLDAAAKWYAQTFGCRYSESTDDDGQRTIVPKFYDVDPGFMLGPSAAYDAPDPLPIIYTDKATKANDYLTRKGVMVGPVQQDSQGTNFFEIRDCEGNLLEVSEEP